MDMCEHKKLSAAAEWVGDGTISVAAACTDCGAPVEWELGEAPVVAGGPPRARPVMPAVSVGRGFLFAAAEVYSVGRDKIDAVLGCLPAPGYDTSERAEGRKEALAGVLLWARARREAEVAHRPDVNVHKTALAATWDQVERYLEELLGVVS